MLEAVIKALLPYLKELENGPFSGAVAVLGAAIVIIPVIAYWKQVQWLYKWTLEFLRLIFTELQKLVRNGKIYFSKKIYLKLTLLLQKLLQNEAEQKLECE